ncbi:2,3-diketo-5-methylthiopentyl-1-phosphate enolase [Paenibacillus radicis (ex Xue et al. 2023)]|uniref:2,3-diketo-5-methylthiopentyl-1-phosphate enolase n=1 Tax=Paenibacillus radicis (ex Xue et al. 2023) TaxID=2972489 RepID=A0ABT1YQA0_9BACL|nr:2,3-diketo-5-methylthiopentyl-1-phosphate enolase [Paenibacillus radicis (ex Xue et al. 2023)]MCR8634925.1 2,3-diketo-5-methylthiopentyl-1-phosphate enolase [Paenibacillus radicis (ex Xue et al. 2023)]
MNPYCVATYRCYDEKADFAKKALSIAVGLTVGSWTDLPEAKKAEMEKHLGKVVRVDVHEPEGTGGTASERYADIQIAYPDANFSRDIPALLVTVFGKLSMDGRIKLIDLSFSQDFISAFPGPKFGIQGVRNLLGVHDRPLLMSIFKSVIGHDISALREQFYLQAAGGVDLIKDDEILFENPLTPIEKRVEACIEAAAQSKRETGQELLYAVNLTGSTFGLIDQARKAIAHGANALLFNVLAYGFDALSELSRHPDIKVPIMAHPALAGAFYPSTYHGISANVLLGKLMRLAGADLVLFPSPYGSVVMPREENMAIKEVLLTEQASRYIYTGSGHSADNEEIVANDTALPLKTSFPVPSAGIHPGLVPLILKDFGDQVIVNAGGGVHGHPMGAIAGGQAFRQAIDACQAGIPLQQYADAQHPELQAAVKLWGIKE